MCEWRAGAGDATLTKRRSAAMLKRLEPVMDMTQCTLERDVHLNQKR